MIFFIDATCVDCMKMRVTMQLAGVSHRFFGKEEENHGVARRKKKGVSHHF